MKFTYSFFLNTYIEHDATPKGGARALTRRILGRKGSRGAVSTLLGTRIWEAEDDGHGRIRAVVQMDITFDRTRHDYRQAVDDALPLAFVPAEGVRSVSLHDREGAGEMYSFTCNA